MNGFRGRPAKDRGNGRANKGGAGTGTIPMPAPAKKGSWRSRIWWILVVIFLVIIILPSIMAEMITDWMWFGSQGLAEVYTTRLWLGLGVFAAAGIVSALFTWANWSISWQATRPPTLFPGQRDPLPFSRGLARGLTIVASLLIGLIFGLALSDSWPTILLYIHSTAFGQADPLFGQDIGFYVFALPFYALLRGWLVGLLVVTAIGVLVIYAIAHVPNINRRLAETGPATSRAAVIDAVRPSIDNRTGLHLSLLGAAFLLLIAIGYWLDRYELLYSSRAVAYGAGYTDINAKLPSLYIMMVVAAAMAVLLIVNVWVRTWKVLVGALALWLVALIVVGGIYPAIIQSIVVRPSEFSLEKPYILNNIAATRKAFGLDNFREREVPAVDTVTPDEIAQNQDIVNNIRLWDYRPLVDTYSQLQEIRSYYSFDEVDIDRYVLSGKLRQVMLSPREMATGELNSQVRTWQNEHFVYTHGYGAVVSPVNEIAGEGLPNLWVKNIPPETDIPELKITVPQVYYGEQTDQYVFVNSATQEFDYPLGDTNQYTTYKGTGGVVMPGFLTKLLMAVRFGDGNILLSNYITPQTRVLFHRNIHDMVQTLAPFLTYDHDPYLIIVNGKLYWIQDAYTTTDRYPYSSPYDTGNGNINYIRNSVKIVIDAYDGSATYYVADPTDPIIQAYRGIFPQLFKDMSQMPAGIRAHIRYPEDMMNIQARMYATFHMTDPEVFYTKEDVWNVPLGQQTNTTEPLQAYFVNMRLPGDTTEQFMLILPFTPATKDNMIAWMAGRSDGENYGKVDVIRYPKQQLIYGPAQIEARIDQDPLISQQLTLWSQSGSTVRRGNLLTVPISNTILYVEPLFLQATSSSFPELKRVIVATGASVGIGADLNEALQVAFKLKPGTIIGGGTTTGPTPVPGTTPQPSGTGTPGVTGRTPAELIQSALDHYNRAQDALHAGDWSTYGREMDAMKADLDELARVYGITLGTPTALPSAGPSPTTAP